MLLTDWQPLGAISVVKRVKRKIAHVYCLEQGERGSAFCLRGFDDERYYLQTT
jgi:hypothetical protein